MIETDCPFLSASELHITEQEREALIRAYVFMTTNKKFRHMIDADNSNSNDIIFNMSNWNYKTDCGTVCCIGGTAEMLMNMQGKNFSFDLDGSSASLYNLFYPPFKYNYNKIMIPEATQALYNFLTKGEAHWNEILNKTHLSSCLD